MRTRQRTSSNRTKSFLQITGATSFAGTSNRFFETSRGQGVHSPPDGCLPGAIHDAP